VSFLVFIIRLAAALCSRCERHAIYIQLHRGSKGRYDCLSPRIKFDDATRCADAVRCVETDVIWQLVEYFVDTQLLCVLLHCLIGDGGCKSATNMSVVDEEIGLVGDQISYCLVATFTPRVFSNSPPHWRRVNDDKRAR